MTAFLTGPGVSREVLAAKEKGHYKVFLARPPGLQVATASARPWSGCQELKKR